MHPIDTGPPEDPKKRNESACGLLLIVGFVVALVVYALGILRKDRWWSQHHGDRRR
jgi:hypothetical protein